MKTDNGVYGKDFEFLGYFDTAGSYLLAVHLPNNVFYPMWVLLNDVIYKNDTMSLFRFFV